NARKCSAKPGRAFPLPSPAPSAVPRKRPPGPHAVNNRSFSRNTTERLLEIHQMIAAQKYPNTVQMARLLQVSRKTIKRDIQWLKDHWEAPIDYDFVRRGFFYSGPVDKLPGLATVTEAEMFALLVAHKAI